MSIYPWHREIWQNWQRAQQHKAAESLLITGEAGIGKAAFVQQMAKHYLQQEDVEHHPDFYAVRLQDDKNSLGVEQIRQLTHNLQSTSHQRGLRLGVIFHADTLTTAAANALLKTLEEPLDHVRLILHAHQASRLLPTIRSRVQLWHLPTPPATEVQAWLRQQFPHATDTSLRWAILLSQGTPLTARDLIQAQHWPGSLQWLEQLHQGGLELLPQVEAWSKDHRADLLMRYFWGQLYAHQHPRMLQYFLPELSWVQSQWQGSLNKLQLLEYLYQTYQQIRQEQPHSSLVQRLRPYRGKL